MHAWKHALLQRESEVGRKLVAERRRFNAVLAGGGWATHRHKCGGGTRKGQRCQTHTPTRCRKWVRDARCKKTPKKTPKNWGQNEANETLRKWDEAATTLIRVKGKNTSIPRGSDVNAKNPCLEYVTPESVRFVNVCGMFNDKKKEEYTGTFQLRGECWESAKIPSLRLVHDHHILDQPDGVYVWIIMCYGEKQVPHIVFLRVHSNIEFFTKHLHLIGWLSTISETNKRCVAPYHVDESTKLQFAGELKKETNTGVVSLNFNLQSGSTKMKEINLSLSDQSQLHWLFQMLIARSGQTPRGQTVNIEFNYAADSFITPYMKSTDIELAHIDRVWPENINQYKYRFIENDGVDRWKQMNAAMDRFDASQQFYALDTDDQDKVREFNKIMKLRVSCMQDMNSPWCPW